MIKVKVKKDSNIIKCITITGHANYDEYGKDIVCASVSATVLTTINAILAINDSIIKVIQEQDKMIINILKEDKISLILIDNMLTCLNKISIEYPKNIKIEI